MESCRHPGRDANGEDHEDGNSVQTDFVDLDKDFRESDIKQFIPNTFKHGTIWEKISWCNTITGIQTSITTSKPDSGSM